MFEHEISYYINRGMAFAEGKSSVTLSEILSNALLPQRLRTYFGADAAWMLEKENEARENSRFDHALPQITAIERQLDELLRPTAQFRRDEFLEILERAVKINFNYLCRPRLTLRSFVFRGEDRVTARIALSRLAYFDDYQYLTYVLKKWIEKRYGNEQRDQIHAADFERAAGKIDDQTLQTFTVSDLRTLLSPMYNWISGAQKTSEEAIPTEAFIVFFDDKNIRRLADKLTELQTVSPAMNIDGVCEVIETMLQIQSGENEPETNSRSSINETAMSPAAVPVPSSTITPDVSSTQLSTNVERYTYESANAGAGISDHSERDSTPAQHASEPSIAVNDEYPIDFSAISGKGTQQEFFDDELEDDAETPDGDANNDRETPSAGSQIIQETYAEERTIEVQPVEQPAVVSPAPSENIQNPTISDALKIPPAQNNIAPLGYSDRRSEFKIIGATGAGAPLADLHSLIPADDRKRFIKKLFRRNDAEYEKALEKLNAMQTWKKSSSYIDEIFLHNGVDPYARHAIKFTDAIYSRFILSATAKKP